MTRQDRLLLELAFHTGCPVVRDTRVPVRAILGYLVHSDTAERLLTDFPNRTEDDVRTAEIPLR